MDEFQREIYKTIDIIMEQKMKQLKFDKSRRGKIISTGSENCVVEIDGETFACKVALGLTVQVGDIVSIKFPQNNEVDKYVDAILSRI